MQKDLKKILYLLGITTLLSGCQEKASKVESKDVVSLNQEETNISIEKIKVLDCDAYSWYTNISNGAEAFYGKKLYIEDDAVNEMLQSSYFYRGIYFDEHAFLGDNYISLQDENSMIHSYSGASLESLEDALLEQGMEEYIKMFYTTDELLELNRLLNVLPKTEISYNERILYK